ncbi:MAG: hypothetical protein LUC43_09470 [Burkholderiales bacterium]|nr:hypothetical protein [Burkholderiales bacterium]
MYPYGNHCHVSYVDLKLADKNSTVKNWQVCYLDKRGDIGPSQVNGTKAYLDLVGLKTNPVVFLEFDQENISPLSEYEITRSYYKAV